MKFSRVILASVVGLSASIAMAQSELDNESKVTNRMERPANLPGTLIMRVNEKTNEVQVLHLQDELAADQATVANFADAKFHTVNADQKYAQQEFNELDSDKAVTSWYFYYGYNPYAYGYGYGYYNYYTPYYYYGYAAYAYAPYYSYNYYGWNYGYYRPYGYW